MTPEDQEAHTLRHETDATFLRSVGLALEAEALRRRAEGEDALTHETAAAFVAAIPE